MGKMKERISSKESGETYLKNEYVKCCGSCKCCKETGDQGLLCTKHGIRTEYVNLCYAWEAKAET